MIDTLNQIIEDGFRRKLVHNFTTPNPQLPNNTIVIDDNEMIHFGSCSYLGLEKNRTLQNGVINAVMKYGTQFSSSRGYVSVDLYQELEQLMFQIFNKPAIVSASTTLGHLATIPVLVGKNDAVILDLQVHSSIQMTVQQLKAKNIPIHIIKHNCMESLENQIKKLYNKHEKIWYFADGIYSMYGDYAPFEALDSLLNTYDKFHLYIDDAHGMGWTGKSGCGVVWSKMQQSEKMILTVSLNKSFAAAGGCIVFPNEETAKKVRNCGPTYLFSGPIQPPMLGAAVASAKLHLSEEIKPMQDTLWELIQYTNQRLDALGFPQFQKTDSPVFFIPVGLPKICYDIISKMKDKGFFVNTASFPVVPMRKSGIRFMITTFLDKTHINSMLTTLCEVYAETIMENEMTYEKIAKTFSIPNFNIHIEKQHIRNESNEKLQVELFRTIKDLDEKEWNATYSRNGTLSYANLNLIEDVYSHQTTPENNWDFYYLLIKDHTQKVILKTPITVALIKDDIFHPGYVSEKIENLRLENTPYFLTSKTVITGTLITKGNHVYIDYKNKHWKKALSLFIEQLYKVLETSKATKIMIRDFYGQQDSEFETEMLERGFIKFQLPNNMEVEHLTWNDRNQYLKSLPQKYRYNVKKEIIQYEPNFETSYTKPNSEVEISQVYKLYEQVFEKSYDLNVFKLTYEYFQRMCTSDEYDVIRLYLKDDESKHTNRLVGVMFSHIHEDVYNALIVGLDYEYVYSHKTYKQILFKTLLRARALNCRKLDLAFTAEMEKKKIGARPKEVFAYMQATEHLKGSMLEFM
ncbi:aminotransferase class I/II-fold pyridoxal phosphate-dependent enzyme [uncultured Kordia sp.]|uniref:aminotransferase class I/II-fold pyridoxal phosphate-dependent enzyme n=1 Tax=uncultured Kordia sp. TaxID=507699 RepID=UPI002616FBBB|nr:aminotransferase class I/II-fold pyridoxal phosphate-dependent enzyme [uncultured Kordia sp.]